jgi:tRNA-dihydrouridine synthase 2
MGYVYEDSMLQLQMQSSYRGKKTSSLTRRSYITGPETIDKAIIGCTRTPNPLTNTIDYRKSDRIIFRTCPSREKSRLIFQIGTASAELAVEAAKIIAEDVSGIDVNAGCPKV